MCPDFNNSFTYIVRWIAEKLLYVLPEHHSDHTRVLVFSLIQLQINLQYYSMCPKCECPKSPSAHICA